MANETAVLQVQLEAMTTAFETSMAKAAQQMNEFKGAAKATESALGGMGGAVFKFNQVLQAATGGWGLLVGAFGKAKGFIDARQQIESLRGSFVTLLGDGDRASDMVDRLFNIVSKTGVSFHAAEGAIHTLALAMGELGSSNKDIEQVTQAFLEAAKIGGASTEQAASALFQFSQGLQVGALRGQDFKSVMSQTPEVLKQIANALGISLSQLQAMASEGTLSAQTVVDAMKKAAPAIEKAFANIPQSLDAQFNKIGGMFTRFMSDVNKEFSVNEGLSAMMNALADAIGYVLDNVKDFLVFLKPLAPLLEAAAIAVGLVEAAMWALNGAMDANPIGIVVAALALLVINFKKVHAAILTVAITMGEWIQKFGSWIGIATEGTDKMVAGWKKTRDELSSTAKDLKSVGDATGHAGHVAEKTKDAFTKWTETIQKALTSVDDIPRKMKYLEQQMEKTTDPLKLVRLREQLEKLRKEDPVAALADQWRKAQDPAAELWGKVDLLNAEFEAGHVSVKDYQDAMSELNKEIGKVTASTATAADKIDAWLRQQAATYKENSEQIKELQDRLDKGLVPPEAIEAAKNHLEQLKQGIAGMSDEWAKYKKEFQDKFLDTLVDGFEKGKWAFKDMLKSFASEILKANLKQMLSKELTFDKITGGFGGIGGLFGSLKGAFGFAKGGIFDKGTFGDHLNSIVNSPTFFDFKAASRSMQPGVMGEAGAEAVIPLTRGADGKLGLAGGGKSDVNITVINNAPVQVQTDTTQNSSGGTDITMTIVSTVAGAIVGGELDGAMGSAYGLRRRGY